jgi:hypothetical protein
VFIIQHQILVDRLLSKGIGKMYLLLNTRMLTTPKEKMSEQKWSAEKV